MYSPDGFASLACALHGECFFLGFQAPFVWLMQLLNGNYYLFFALQALTWFAVIIAVYLLAKELKVKHLFLAPFLVLFGCTLFIDNYVGSFENDYIAIVLFILAIILVLKNEKVCNLWAFNLVGIGTLFWFWVGHLRLPVLISPIAEEMWWVQILAWGFITPIFLLAVITSLWAIWNKKDFQHLGFLCLIAFCFPKLWFLAIPMMLKVFDVGLSQFDFKPNYLFWMKIIVFALLLGQVLRVGLFTFEAWNYNTDNTKCFTVNHEYLARVKGISLNYNQASIDEYNKCLINEGLHNGT
jgi:hypothetical protein